MHVSSKLLRATAVALGLAGFAGMANASLTLSLVPISAGSSADVTISGNTVTVGAVGDKVAFKVMATVSADTPNGTPDEGLQFALGSALNNIVGSGPAGSFSTFTPVSGWNQGFQAGTPQANGDLGPGAAGVSSGDYAKPRSGNNPNVDDSNADGTTPYPSGVTGNYLAPSSSTGTDSATWQVGKLTWTVNSLGGGTGSDNVYWQHAPDLGGSAGGSWVENTNLVRTTTGGKYLDQAVPVSIVAPAPEPGTLGLLALGGLGLLIRRRAK